LPGFTAAVFENYSNKFSRMRIISPFVTGKSGSVTEKITPPDGLFLAGIFAPPFCAGRGFGKSAAYEAPPDRSKRFPFAPMTGEPQKPPRGGSGEASADLSSKGIHLAASTIYSSAIVSKTRENVLTLWLG
jgi:hypothetical protein